MGNGISRQRRTAYFGGHVQGVGFRYTTERIAGGYAVEGFVQNLPDGRVLVVAEGEPDELDRFFGRLQNQMAQHIRQTHITPAQATGEFAGFGVRY